MILAIDQGTSSTKALLVEGTTVIAEAECAVHPVATADGGVEQDPEQLWDSVVTAGRQALAAAGHPTVDGIGLANQGETVLAWDRATGTPIGNALSWQDRRAVDVCVELDMFAEALARRTGLSLDPYFSAPKMTWLRRRVGPEPTITTSDTWLLHRLCGAFVTDASTASRSMLMDLDTVTWSASAAERFDIDVATLPAIVDNTTPVGTTEVFGGSIPVTGLCVDQQAALWAEHCRAAGEAKCTYGTGAFLLASTGRTPVRSSAGLVGCVAWRLQGTPTWCLDGQVYTVGSAVSWLQELGLIGDPADLDRLGGAVPSSEGVQFVPALAGLGAPFWAPEARGSWTGLSLATGRGQLIRSVIDGIAAQVAWLTRAVGTDLGAPMQRLRVDGGLTRSHVLLQTQADLAQLPVEVYPSPNATALGVASFAAIGLGHDDDHAPVEPSAVYEPRISADEADHRLGRWHAAAVAAVAAVDASANHG